MRAVTGAILILAAEQAFAHAHLVSFPDQLYVRSILVPAAALLGSVGVTMLIWGLLSERRPT